MENYTPDYFFDDVPEQKKRQQRKFPTILLGAGIFLCLTVFTIHLGVSTHRLINPENPTELDDEQKLALIEKLAQTYPEEIVKPLPYNTIPADLMVNAESAIIIDQETGNVLYEKNADMEIPPASMTKLVEMYVVYEAVRNGEVSFDDYVPLPPQSWAKNLPSDASIMFLAEGQRVTLRELLLGLAIASGNDASIAVANYVCDDMDSFVERMNKVIKNLGLEKTHFVESSGYSEKNITTAREFVSFCRIYLRDFPESIDNYHSQKVLMYPLEKNLPLDQKYKGDSEAVIQYNTNKLLGILEGCDGLKTGFIDESGYNIALTAQRGERRFISVTMKGPGKGSVQGNKYRVKDGTTLMEFAFSKFAPYIPKEKGHSFVVGCAGSAEKSIRLIPALDEKFSVPFITGNSPEDAASKIHVTANIPSYLYGQVECGQELGLLTYSLEGKTLRTIPLVADRKSQRQNIFGRLWGKIVYKTAGLF
ncbi:D-alanyl-D-alanine carboxypeptidase family protein [Treponema sp.]|uniref:D-alanyl-D-alanine carboxypeptidase family protein n=1 Tax=Treponema sp. TaxID=166 RepID=UPI00388E3048